MTKALMLAQNAIILGLTTQTLNNFFIVIHVNKEEQINALVA